MSVLVYRDSDTLSQALATLLAGCMIEKPNSVLGLDCSAQLASAYRKVAGMTSDGLLDWASVRAFNLFEHVRQEGEPTDEARMHSMLYDRVNILPENIYAPCAQTRDWSILCNDYENAILDVGGLDIFAPEDVAFAHRLIAAGVPVELHVYPGCPHAFDLLVPDAEVSQRVIAHRVRYLAGL